MGIDAQAALAGACSTSRSNSTRTPLPKLAILLNLELRPLRLHAIVGYVVDPRRETVSTKPAESFRVVVAIVVAVAVVWGAVALFSRGSDSTTPPAAQPRPAESAEQRRQRQWMEDNAGAIKELKRQADECSERPSRCK